MTNATERMDADVRAIKWAADYLGVTERTAYTLAQDGELPGAFRVGRQWRVSVPRFLADVHGIAPATEEDPS